MCALEEEDTTSPGGMASEEGRISNMGHSFFEVSNKSCFKNGLRVIPVEKGGGLN